MISMNSATLYPLINPPEEELILHSFSLLKKTKECIDTIIIEEDMDLDISSLQPTSAAQPTKIGLSIVLKAVSSAGTYQINNPEILKQLSSFKPQSQESVMWLCQNFNIDKQNYENLVFKKPAAVFIRSFLRGPSHINTSNASFKETLINTLDDMDGLVLCLNNLNELEFKDLIEKYFILQEKKTITQELESIRPNSEPGLTKIVKI